MNVKKLSLLSLSLMGVVPVQSMKFGQRLLGGAVSGACLAAVGYPVYQSANERIPRLTDPETVWGKDLPPKTRAFVEAELRKAGIDPKSIRLKYTYDVNNPGNPGSIEAVGNHSLVFAADKKDLPHYPQCQLDHALKTELRQDSYLHKITKAFSSDEWKPEGEYASVNADDQESAHALSRFIIQRATAQSKNNQYMVETVLEIAIPCALYAGAKIIKQPFPAFKSLSKRQIGKVASTGLQLGASYGALLVAKSHLDQEADKSIANDPKILKAGAQALRYQADRERSMLKGMVQKVINNPAGTVQETYRVAFDPVYATASVVEGVANLAMKPLRIHSLDQRARNLEARAQEILHTPPQ